MNQVQKTDSSVPSTHVRSGQSDQVLSGDFIIPKIIQMQALSDWVTDGKAKAGDFVRSSTVSVVGGRDKPLEFIPLTFKNLWMLSANENGDNKTFDFKGYEDRTASNEMDPWEFFKDGVKYKRTKVMNLFALLPSDIDAQILAIEKYKSTGEMPDLDAAVLPVLIQFRNTSFKAAKDVILLFTKAASLAEQMGVAVPPYGRTMALGNTLEKNDMGAFFVLNVKGSGPTKKEYLAAAEKWRGTLVSMGPEVKIDDADIVAGAVKEAGEVFQNQF